MADAMGPDVDPDILLAATVGRSHDQRIGRLMPHRRPTRQGEPSYVVLDNEALAQITSGRPSRPLLVALEAAAATTGRVLLPTCVVQAL